MLYCLYLRISLVGIREIERGVVLGSATTLRTNEYLGILPLLFCQPHIVSSMFPSLPRSTRPLSYISEPLTYQSAAHERP